MFISDDRGGSRVLPLYLLWHSIFGFGSSSIRLLISETILQRTEKSQSFRGFNESSKDIGVCLYWDLP